MVLILLLQCNNSLNRGHSDYMTIADRVLQLNLIPLRGHLPYLGECLNKTMCHPHPVLWQPQLLLRGRLIRDNPREIPLEEVMLLPTYNLVGLILGTVSNMMAS